MVEQLKQLLKLHKLIHRYILAAVNLYGVIKIEDFMNVFHHYEQQDLTFAELTGFFESITNQEEHDFFYNDEILTNGYFPLYEDEIIEEVNQIMAEQHNKPRFLPDKADFLKFQDAAYIEPLKILVDFKNFILKNELTIEKNNDEDVMFDVMELHDIIQTEGSIQSFFDYIQGRNYQFKEERLMHLFFSFVKEVNNHTRLYENNGFTPNELRLLHKK